MKTFLVEDYARIWIDEFIPCVFTSLNSSVDKNSMKFISESTRKALLEIKKISKSRKIFSITDLASCTKLSTEIIDAYCHIIDMEAKLGLKFKYIIEPHNKSEATLLNQVLSKWIYLPVSVFPNFEQALIELNKEREKVYNWEETDEITYKSIHN